jgi:protein-disulfide isomerase
VPVLLPRDATLKQVAEKYGDKLRIVFRDFPLVQIHNNAAKAAEAAECAHEQGKFWEMHDKLFADQSKLQVEALKKAATDIGLDSEKFNQCWTPPSTPRRCRRTWTRGRVTASRAPRPSSSTAGC